MSGTVFRGWAIRSEVGNLISFDLSRRWLQGAWYGQGTTSGLGGRDLSRDQPWQREERNFFKEADFEAFERLIAQGLAIFAVDLLAYQWMKNHWLMVLSPQVDGGMTAFIGWITLTHMQQHHAHHGTTGRGHVDSGRFKSLPI